MQNVVPQPGVSTTKRVLLCTMNQTRLLFTGCPAGTLGTISRAARSAGAAIGAALLELANASNLSALPRRRDERPARA